MSKPKVSNSSILAGLRAAFGDSPLVKSTSDSMKKAATQRLKRKIPLDTLEIKPAWDEVPGSKLTAVIVFFQTQHCTNCGHDHSFVANIMLEVTGRNFRHLIASTTGVSPELIQQLPKRWEWASTPTDTPICPDCARLGESVDDLLAALELTTSPRQSLLFHGI